MQFAGVAPGVDLWTVLGASSVEQLLILRQAVAQSSWRLPLAVTGASLVAQADGSVGVVTTGGGARR